MRVLRDELAPHAAPEAIVSEVIDLPAGLSAQLGAATEL
jgi:hypothetical protein